MNVRVVCFVSGVNCRIGSLEICREVRDGHAVVNCRIGSLEICTGMPV